MIAAWIRGLLWASAAALLLVASPGRARQVTAAEYARAAQFLGRSTDPLVGRNYDPRVYHEVTEVHWLDATHFWYRDHGRRGDRFLEMDAATGRIAPAFDEAALGAALGKALGRPVDARHWPHGFTFHRLPSGELAVDVGAEAWTCELRGTATCTPDAHPGAREALSPDGRWLAFVKDQNLWLRDAATGASVELAGNGTADDGYAAPYSHGSTATVRWSPDSKRFVVFRFDARGVRKLYTVRTRVGHPALETWPYPVPGDQHVFRVALAVVDVAERKLTPLQMPEEQQLGPWDTIQWAPDDRTFALVSTSRDRRQETFRVANATTGAVRTAFTYHARDYYLGEYSAKPYYIQWPGRPDWRYLPAWGAAIWPDARNGWMNLYLRDLATGREIRPLTTGVGDVIQVLHVDRRTHTLWYVGTGRTPGVNPYYMQLFKLDIDTGRTTLLTPEDANHDITMAPDGKYFVDAYSTPTTPPVTVLRAAATGRVIATIARTDVSHLVAAGWVPPVPFTVMARDGKTPLYGLLYKPSNFDPHRSYPVIDFVYPGPQIGSIATFGFRAEHGASQALAELGFIVVTLDGTCTPYRSASFQRACYGDIGDDTIPDQVAGIRELAARRPWMDLARVGIWGHSGGGNATVSAMLHYPDFFKVGWAESGNYDARSYFYTWGEKWEGPLATHRDGTSSYDNQALPLLAGNLKGELMLVHGAIDNNVPIGITFQLASALMRANRNFHMLIVPNERHHFGPYTPYVTRRMFDFFVRYLAGDTPPHGFDGMPKSLTQ